MAARTFTEVLNATRSRWINNLTLQEKYGLDASLSWDDQFSNVAFESILTYVFSYCIWLYETIVFDKADEVTATISNEHKFSIPWYSAISKSFQLGDELVYNETTYKHDYAIIDESKQIVKFTTVRKRQVSGVTTLQVFATKANKAAMTADELAAFSSYMELRGAGGDHFQFISLAPDQLVLNLTVYYNPQILSSSGAKLSDGTKPVDLAIAAYLDGIKYAGAFNRTKQADAVEASDGVVDVILGDVRLNGDLKNDRQFESASGFYVAQTINVTYIAS